MNGANILRPRFEDERFDFIWCYCGLHKKLAMLPGLTGMRISSVGERNR